MCPWTFRKASRILDAAKHEVEKKKSDFQPMRRLMSLPQNVGPFLGRRHGAGGGDTHTGPCAAFLLRFEVIPFLKEGKSGG